MLTDNPSITNNPYVSHFALDPNPSVHFVFLNGSFNFHVMRKNNAFYPPMPCPVCQNFGVSATCWLAGCGQRPTDLLAASHLYSDSQQREWLSADSGCLFSLFHFTSRQNQAGRILALILFKSVWEERTPRMKKPVKMHLWFEWCGDTVLIWAILWRTCMSWLQSERSRQLLKMWF